MSFLIGYMAGAGPTLTYIGISTSNSGSSISPHASAAVGDLAVLFDRASSTAGFPTSVVPTGFTSVVNQADQFASRYNRLVVSYRKLASTSSITGMSGAEHINKQLLIFRCSNGIASLANSTWNIQSNGNTSGFSDQSVAASAGVAPLIVLAHISAVAASPDIACAPGFDAELAYATGGSPGLAQDVGYIIQNGSLADVGGINFSSGNNSNYLCSGYIQVTP